MDDLIIDFDSLFPSRDLVAHALKCPSSIGDTTLPAPGLVMGGPVAVARVDHGRWIADCPTDGCTGAEFVSRTGTHAFFCCECRNAGTGHVPVPVLLPDEETVGQVDAYLSARPAPANRNWSPEQTVEDLQLENRENGIKLP